MCVTCLTCAYRDPELFADIIREGVPADQFCAEGLSKLIPSLLIAHGISNIENASICLKDAGEI
jgi:hypothetical protein